LRIVANRSIGGLRYLKGYHFGLIRERLRERSILLKITPQLVRLYAFRIPVYEDAPTQPINPYGTSKTLALACSYRCARTAPNRSALSAPGVSPSL
jgi:glycerol-3-phosphate dehydrogenase